MKLYRYDWDLILRRFKVIKETPCGYWVEVDMFERPSGRRWTSKHSVSRFAYPSKEEALDNFIARKRRQIKILEGNLEDARHWKIQAEKLKQLGEEQYKKSYPFHFSLFMESL